MVRPAQPLPERPIQTGERVLLRVMGCGYGTVVETGLRWMGRHDAIRVKRDEELGKGLLYWAAEMERVEKLASAEVPHKAAPHTIDNEIYWARRWIEKATPGEIAAMKELIAHA